MSDTRWVATYEPGDGKGWRARAEFYQATTMVRHLTCPHSHRTQRAAEACARSMVGEERPERIAI